MKTTSRDIKEQLENWKEIIEANCKIKYITYGAIALAGIWILGKGSKILADSTRNFKELHNAIKG